MKALKTDISGFTLIEIMVATMITMMIIGSVYAAFRSSLDAYQRYEIRSVMLQRCRSALDRMTRDASNLFFISGDEEMNLFSENFSDTETAMDKDMISFVAIVEPNLKNYEPLDESEVNLDEEENNLPSDLARIVYYVGPSPDDATVQSLMRIETINLDTDEVNSLLEELTSSSISEETTEQLKTGILIDYVGGLNIRYFDGSDWVDTWDTEEQEGLPKALEITLTVIDAERGDKTLTEAVVVFLPMSRTATQTEEQ